MFPMGIKIICLFTCVFGTKLEPYYETVRIIVCNDPPYIIYGPGLDDYTGYSIDLLKELQQIFPFNYTIEFYPNPDSNVTRFFESVDAIVEKIYKNESDLGITGMPVTYDYEDKVDYTVTITRKLSRMGKLRKREIQNYGVQNYLFVQVVDLNLIMLIAVSFVIYTLSLWICELGSPFSYGNQTIESKFSLFI